MIRSLELIHFGAFHHFKMDLSQGLNIIEGQNEAGKTTIFHFILAIFYGFSKDSTSRKSYNQYYDQYRPIEGASYMGAMELEFKGKLYRIERNFIKEAEYCRIWDMNSKESLEDDPRLFQFSRISQPGALFFQLDQESFLQYFGLKDLLFFQKEKFLQEEIYLAQSFSLTKNSHIDPQGAINFLETRKKEIGSPRSKLSKWGKIQREMEECQKWTKESLFTRIDLDKNLSKLNRLQEEKSDLKGKRDKFFSLSPPIEESNIQKEYELLASMQEIHRRGIFLEEKITENEEKMDSYEKRYPWLQDKNQKNRRVELALALLILAFSFIILVYSIFNQSSTFSLLSIGVLLLSLVGLFVINRLSFRDRLIEREYSHLFHQQDQNLLEKNSLIKKARELSSENLPEGELLASLASFIERKQSLIASWNYEKTNPYMAEIERKEREIEGEEARTNLLLDQLEEKRQEEEKYEKRLKALEEKAENLEEEWEAINRAQKIIGDILRDHSKKHKDRFYEKASEFFDYASQGKYCDLIKEKQGFSFFHQEKGIRLDQEKLSRSGQEIMLLSLRMAMLDSKAGPDLPLIMDDCLVHFDEDRKKRIIYALSKLNRQVIFLSKDKMDPSQGNRLIKI